MSIGRGRVLKGPVTAEPIAFAPTAQQRTGRRVPGAVVDASARAQRILADAETRATTLVEAAARAAGDVRLRAEAEGRADGIAQVAARAVELSAHEARADERALDRTVEVARILAERLLGESLRLDPSTVKALARQALSEARGARRVRIVAHPSDVERLEGRAPEPRAAGSTAGDRRGPGAIPRGDLRLETDIGVLDAALSPQLDRLARSSANR